MGQFQIDDVVVPQPRSMRYTPRPLVGLTLSGLPVHQGYPALECTFNVLTLAEMKVLYDCWDPNDPSVEITFDDPYDATSSTYYAVMHEPSFGSRAPMHFLGVSVRFTRLVSSGTIHAA